MPGRFKNKNKRKSKKHNRRTGQKHIDHFGAEMRQFAEQQLNPEKQKDIRKKLKVTLS